MYPFCWHYRASDGTAKTILNAFQQLCDREHLDLENKYVAFGSGGAAVMIGFYAGLATLLKRSAHG